MKKHNVICAGHICIDITPVFGQDVRYKSVGEVLKPGSLINVSGAEIRTGGSVANTGLAMKLLGCDVTLLGKTGNDHFGDILRGIVASYGGKGIAGADDCGTSYSVVLAIPGVDRIFLHDPGANDTFGAEDVDEDLLKEAELFHFGYPPLMKRMYENGGEELVKIFEKAKKAGCVTSLDMAAVDPKSDAGKADWKLILKRVLPLVDFFVPSIDELSFMLGGCADVHALASQCIKLGAKHVLIKRGTDGMYLKTADVDGLKEGWRNVEIAQPCFKVEKVLSATGAGDAAIAAFLAAVLEGYEPGECVRFAAAEGALSVTSYDTLAAIEPLESLKKRIEGGWEEGN